MQNKETVTVNRIYKDRLFRLIFNDKRRLLDLYNAMNRTSYVQEDDLEIVTLECHLHEDEK